MSDDAQPQPAEATVIVKMQQAYDVNLTLSFLPTQELTGVMKLGCQPRQGAQRMSKDPLDLPEPTRKWLLDADKIVIAWLAQDENNQRLFITDPIAALREAGVPMERAHLKAITRARQNIGTSQAVVPGLQMRSVRTTTRQRGRVKPVDRVRPDWSPARRHNDNDCGCGSKPGRK